MRDFIYIVIGALLLVGCTRDLTDQTISEGTTTTSDKILNDTEDAIQGSILVRFVPNAESRLATRSDATRTGIEGVDMILDNIKGYAVEPVFNITEKNKSSNIELIAYSAKRKLS